MVYRADRSTVGVYELFSVPTDFSAPSVRLNGPLPAGGSVAGLGFAGFSDFAIGAGDRVAYRADQTVPGTFELFSVPADGSASPLRLSPALVRVSSLWLSPAEDEVYFTTERSLYRVPLDGSTASRPVAADIPLEPMAFSPDGSTILGTHSPVEERAGLYTVPADGSATPVLLLEGGTSGFGYYSRFEDPRFASDGVHVLLNLENYYEVLYYDLFSVRWKSLGDRARAGGRAAARAVARRAPPAQPHPVRLFRELRARRGLADRSHGLPGGLCRLFGRLRRCPARCAHPRGLDLGIRPHRGQWIRRRL